MYIDLSNRKALGVESILEIYFMALMAISTLHYRQLMDFGQIRVDLHSKGTSADRHRSEQRWSNTFPKSSHPLPSPRLSETISH